MENMNQANESQINNNPPKKSKGKKIILIIVILLVIGGIASYFMPGNLNIWKKLQISINPNLVAIVDGEEITKNELESRINLVKENVKSQGIDVSDEKTLKEIEASTLDEMINEKVLFQDAKKKGIVASDSEVEKTYNEIVAQYKNKEDFAKDLTAKNLTEQTLRESIAKQLTLIKYIGQNIDPKNITASEKEISDLYNTVSASQKNMTMPKLEDIKTQLENEVKQGKSRVKILELINKLKEGIKIDVFI